MNKQEQGQGQTNVTNTATNTTTTVKITRGAGQLLWLESTEDASLMVAVQRVGGWKSEDFAHTLYLGVTSDTVYDVVYDIRPYSRGRRWISRTFQEVK